MTAVRSREARLAAWSEVDLQAAVWTDGSGLLFPSPTGKALPNMTTSKLLNRSGIDATTHGFRTSFRFWCADHDESRELDEAALAHVVAGVEGAYVRSDLFERRRKLMQAWADYLAGSGAG